MQYAIFLAKIIISLVEAFKLQISIILKQKLILKLLQYGNLLSYENNFAISL